MNVALFIARKLQFGNKEKKKDANPSIRIAIIGIALGLAIMLLAVAIVTGFKHEIQQDVNDNSKPMFTHSNNDTTQKILNHELGNIIEEALKKLPEDYRMVFALREINGLNVAETAALLQISAANVKVRLNRSKSMLRAEIEKSYAAEELFEFNAVYCNAMTDRVMKIVDEL